METAARNGEVTCQEVDARIFWRASWNSFEGAVFTLQKVDESWNGTGEATELTTTKEDFGSDESPATALFKNLKPGKYIIKEKSAPDIFR